MNDKAPTPSTRPLEFLCGVMVLVGLALTLNAAGGFFGQWRARGWLTLAGGIEDPRLSPALATFEGILGGSLVGKWSTAWVLVRKGLPQKAPWALNALAWMLVVFGLFEFGLLVSQGMPAEAALPELFAPGIFALLLFRLCGQPSTDATTQPRLARPFSLRALELFAWMQVAFGLSLGFLALSDPFEFYRHAMGEAWFGDSFPHALAPWLPYAYGLIGAAFAAHFFGLAQIARHAAYQSWALKTWFGTIVAWFTVDSVACAVQGAWFNIWIVNLPALAMSLVLIAWAKRQLGASPQVQTRSE